MKRAVELQQQIDLLKADKMHLSKNVEILTDRCHSLERDKERCVLADGRLLLVGYSLLVLLADRGGRLFPSQAHHEAAEPQAQQRRNAGETVSPKRLLLGAA